MCIRDSHATGPDRRFGGGVRSCPHVRHLRCPRLPGTHHRGLEHGGFRPGTDAFVYAGDFVDRGPDVQGCLEVIESQATEVLVGNHELAVLIGFRLSEQTRESRALRQLLLDRVLAADPATAWKAVTSVDGILISHGGIAECYAPVFHRDCAANPERLADYLNEKFLQAVRQELETGAWDAGGILGKGGPLWFRPFERAGGRPLLSLIHISEPTRPY